MRDRRTIQEKEAEGTGETFKRNEREIGETGETGEREKRQERERQVTKTERPSST